MSKFWMASGLTMTVLLSACSSLGGGAYPTQANLQPTRGNAAQGAVQLRQEGDGVVLLAKVSGLTPGAHGFHIHEKGDCSAPDGTSAGGHFNPTAKPHGHPGHGDHHSGDLPQLVADASGNATLEARLSGVDLGTGPLGIAGRSFVIHAAPDDFTSQPAGNSGPRIACGVIPAS